MTRQITLLMLAILRLSTIAVSASTNCCEGRSSSDVETINDCLNCSTGCDCSAENCELCQGYEKCCRTCCEHQCDCLSLNCNSCGSQSSQCCSRCCGTRCRSSRSSCISQRACSQCNCETCSTKQITQQSQSSHQQQPACCNSCCKEKEQEKLRENSASSTNVSQITTLPNITIIINHAPIYVNNTPNIKTEQRCGNASVLSNGTHIVYVYPQNSTCANRTCCTRQVQPPCRARPFMPPACPPPMYVRDCSSRCFMQSAMQSAMLPAMAPVMPPVMPPPAPCQYFQSWPFVHCPQMGCYGFGCAPAPPPPMMVQGCIPVSSWPFVRCVPGMGSDSVVSYGPPSYQVMGPGVSSSGVPFSSTDHGVGYPPAGLPVGASPPGFGMNVETP